MKNFELAKESIVEFKIDLGVHYYRQFMNLVNWLGEWQDHLEMVEKEKEDFAIHASLAEYYSIINQIREDEKHFFYKKEEKEAKAGQIRLVRPGCGLDGVWKPNFIALYQQWPEEEILTCQFSVLTTPATPGEFKTGRQESRFSVLCPWNSFATDKELLEEHSWYVGELTEEEMRKSKRLFRSLVRGFHFDRDVIDQIGPPIGPEMSLKSKDPRWDYLHTIEKSNQILRPVY